MEFVASIKGMKIKDSRDGKMVVTSIESALEETPVAELGASISTDVTVTIKNRQLSFIDYETGEGRRS